MLKDSKGVINIDNGRFKIKYLIVEWIFYIKVNVLLKIFDKKMNKINTNLK